MKFKYYILRNWARTNPMAIILLVVVPYLKDDHEIFSHFLKITLPFVILTGFRKHIP